MPAARVVAEWFLRKQDNENTHGGGESISNLKVQKLLYYAQGFHLAFYCSPLFPEEIRGWTHGPVVVPVYEQFSKFGAGPITSDLEGDLEGITTQHEELLNDVWRAYGQFSAWALRDRTHGEPPWRDLSVETGRTEGDLGIISHEALTDYFKTQLV